MQFLHNLFNAADKGIVNAVVLEPLKEVAVNYFIKSILKVKRKDA